MGRKGNTHGELRLRVKLVQVGATPLWTTLTQPCLQRHRLPAGRIAPHGVHLLSNAPRATARAMPALNEVLASAGVTLQSELLDRVDRDKAHLLPPTGAPCLSLPSSPEEHLAAASGSRACAMRC